MTIAVLDDKRTDARRAAAALALAAGPWTYDLATVACAASHSVTALNLYAAKQACARWIVGDEVFNLPAESVAALLTSEKLSVFPEAALLLGLRSDGVTAPAAMKAIERYLGDEDAGHSPAYAAIMLAAAGQLRAIEMLVHRGKGLRPLTESRDLANVLNPHYALHEAAAALYPTPTVDH